MNGHRALIAAMTLTACLAWAGDVMAQAHADNTRAGDIADFRPDLICRVKAWYVSGGYSVHYEPISSGASLHWPNTRPVRILVEVSNQGGRNAGPFHSVVRITKNGHQIALPTGLSRAIPFLGTRQVWRSTYFQVPLSEGTVDRYHEIHTPATNEIAVSVDLDIGNSVTEWVETNNQCDHQFTIVVD